jgi:hypothetical protein
MPFYVYRCTSGHVHDEVRKIDYRNYPSTCPVCKMDATRFLGGEHVNAQNDFEHPVYSEALGVHPSQVAEAKRKFPHHEFTSNGLMVIRSTQERERIRKDLGFSG